ncbi:MAG: XisI protein [Acidobacteriota bacterium]|nr:XisI protein [Acidobacteriota bacterium]
MDRVNKYRKIIEAILKEQASYGSSNEKIDVYAICDEKTDNYILSNLGWHPSGHRQQGYPIHIRLKNGKVWVEWDGTDQEIVRQLIDAGIPEADIVLGFNQPQEFLKAA